MTGLVERLEKATGGDREIDVLLWREFGWSDVRDPERNSVTDILGPDAQVMGATLAQAIERWPNDMAGVARNWNIPRLTASLDAALALVERVLPGWDICLSRVKGDEAATWNAVVGEPDSFSGSEASKPSPALALCLAALKALAQGNEG